MGGRFRCLVGTKTNLHAHNNTRGDGLAVTKVQLFSGKVNVCIKGKLFLCSSNWTLRDGDVWGSGCIDPHILDLGVRWRWVVSFTPRPLYPQGNIPVFKVQGLDETHNQSGRCGMERSFVPTGTGTTAPRPLPGNQSLYRLSYRNSSLIYIYQ
jgi:hypothetical protein